MPRRQRLLAEHVQHRAGEAYVSALGYSLRACYPALQSRGQGMPTIRTADPVLVRFRQALHVVYGNKLERVVLFGSRARGDARPDSDYDIAVFLNEPGSFGDEAARLAAIETDIRCDTGVVIEAVPFHAGAYRESTGPVSEPRCDGVDP